MIATLPIFPLSGVLLFPGTYLPLHIFEPRYRLMMDYCLENDNEIGITSYRDSNLIEPVFGWGKIIKRDPFPDGRSNIIVNGMGIAKLVRFKTVEPFIIASVEKRPNSYQHLHTVEFRTVLLEILNLTKQHLLVSDAGFNSDGSGASAAEDLEKLKKHPFPLDVIASFLRLDMNSKLDILTCEDDYEKAEKLLFYLKNLITGGPNG